MNGPSPVMLPGTKVVSAGMASVTITLGSFTAPTFRTYSVYVTSSPGAGEPSSAEAL